MDCLVLIALLLGRFGFMWLGCFLGCLVGCLFGLFGLLTSAPIWRFGVVFFCAGGWMLGDVAGLCGWYRFLVWVSWWFCFLVGLV